MKKTIKNNLNAVLFLAIIIALAGGGIYLINRKDSADSGSSGEISGTFDQNLIGKKMPDFSFKDADGKVYTLEGLKGKNLVLFFNEGLMCYPGCWSQIASFGTDARFADKNTAVLSVVFDKPQSWKEAVKQMPDLEKAAIVSDDNRVSAKLGILTARSSMHYGALPGHSYIVIDKNGIIRFVYDDPSMRINNDLILDEINKINGI